MLENSGDLINTYCVGNRSPRLTRVRCSVIAAAESVKKAITPLTVLSNVVWKTVKPNELMINEV